jgi:transcriptional regulator with XRE-family HTH domain
MAQVKHREPRGGNLRRQTPRSLRAFLLVQQFEAGEIGARIQQARKERGLTQEELAEMASFSKRSLQDYETGVTIPHQHMAEIGRLLRKPVEWFLYGDDKDEAGKLDEVLSQLQRLRDEVGSLQQQIAETLEPDVPAKPAGRRAPRAPRKAS